MVRPIFSCCKNAEKPVISVRSCHVGRSAANPLHLLGHERRHVDQPPRGKPEGPGLPGPEHR